MLSVTAYLVLRKRREAWQEMLIMLESIHLKYRSTIAEESGVV